MLQFTQTSPWPLAILALAVSLWASVHVLHTKRNVRAASGWFVIVWLLPIIGPALYLMLGINRIQRKALRLRRRRSRRTGGDVVRVRGDRTAPPLPANLRGLARVSSALVDNPLSGENRFEITENGDATYAAMLTAIDRAERTIGLTSYIFCRDDVGRAFVEALKRAQDRGVEVRIIVDGVGVYYSYPTIFREFAAAGLKAAAFLPTWLPGRWLHMNLRNHRKILVIDGKIGFTGGTNIQHVNLERTPARQRILDVHFRITGPVVAQIGEAFLNDWAFVTGEVLDPERWLGVSPEAGGGAWARGISHGPDSSDGPLAPIILAAVNQAQERIRIVSPYFLPDEPLLTGLILAAKRGVAVEIVTPVLGGLRPVEWAATTQFDLLLAAGCRLYAAPFPFDHAKLMTIDGGWSLIGSSNWDPRSLRLNFEFNIEVYDQDFAARIDSLIEARRNRAHAMTLQNGAVAVRPPRSTGRPPNAFSKLLGGRLVLLRNRLLWLFQPYL